MPQFDPWRGTNQGLATLGNTFDTLSERRRQERLDALNEPFLQNRNALSELELREKQDRTSRDSAFREGLSSLESGFATYTVPTEVPNPEYRPPIPGTVPPVDQTGTGTIDPTNIYTKPAEGLPTIQGQRPMSSEEKSDARIQYAMQRGDLEAVSKMAKFVEITEKMDDRAVTKMTNTMKLIEQTRTTMGPAVALEIGKRVLRGMPEVDPALVDKAVLSPQGILSVPDGQGGTVMTIPTPDGKYHVVHTAAQKPNLEAERFEETKRHNRAIENKPGGGGGGKGGSATALMKNTNFLASLGYDRKEAASILSSSKPMSRETFIGQATLRVMNNTFIPEANKPAAIQQAIDIFDSSIKKGAAPTTDKVLDKATAVAILKEAGGDKDKARKLAKDRGYRF